MPAVNKTFTFSAGTTIIAAQHNTNFDTLYNLVNSNLDSTNLASNAAIADTQLAQITTAGKVAIAALTVSSQAAGDIIQATGASTWARLGIGTALQVLRTNAGATAVEWATSTTAATQAEQEAASSTTVSVTPGRQQYHPSAAKAWCSFNGTGTPAMNGTPYNFDASIGDGGTGIYTLTITNDISSANFAVVISCAEVSNSAIVGIVTSKAGSGLTIKCRQSDNQALVDPTWVDVVVYGDL